MIPDARLQQIIASKDQEEALRWCNEHRYVEGWAIIDGTLVIYDVDQPPAWLQVALDAQDDDGNTPYPHGASLTVAA